MGRAEEFILVLSVFLVHKHCLIFYMSKQVNPVGTDLDI